MAKSFGTPLNAEPGTEPEAPKAKAPKAKAQTTPANEPETEPETEQAPAPRSQREVDLLAHLEAREVYKEAGPLYGAVNHIGDIGAEIGFHTGKGSEKQRAGIGIYLRVDHVAKRFPTQDMLDLIDSF